LQNLAFLKKEKKEHYLVCSLEILKFKVIKLILAFEYDLVKQRRSRLFSFCKRTTKS